MDNDATKKYNLLSSIVQLTIGADFGHDLALAAISQNKTVKWIKFILADDKPNANKQRIPEESFDSIIKTGLFMPIKMAPGAIQKGHEFSVPIGVITNLVKNENRVEGIAALWAKEYPDEVEILEKMSSEGKKPQISWEILYNEWEEEADGIEALKDPMLAAATVVKIPAYGGRTSVQAIASEDNKSKEKKTMEIEQKVVELEKRLSTFESEKETWAQEKETYEIKVGELTQSVTDLTKEKVTLTDENKVLKTFKEEADAAKERTEKLESIKTLFSEAGVELPEEYFEDKDKLEKLLAMTTEQVKFWIDELALFSKSSKEAEASTKHKKLGSSVNLNARHEDTEEASPAELVDFLKKELRPQAAASATD